MMIAITGTPGTGKTHLSKELTKRGYKVLDLNDHIRRNGLLEDKDEERDTYCVDVDSLDISLDEHRTKDLTFIEGHISHCVSCDMAIVLRCSPDILAERLKCRGYSDGKVAENVQAEILDVILCEASEADMPVYELDSSDDSPESIADKVTDILAGNTDKYRPGNIDWTGELEKWF
ncbi:MAG: adenylate kinase family protein [Candidatus Methanoplasma sp.]|jgi:adenylate kinase|nr:adenylate kinase family protein [Candidatus Methanoplasma sp.]